MPEPFLIDINHVCIVTHDLDRAVRTWADGYGMGPWNLWTKDATNMKVKVDGEPTEFALRVGLCQVSATFRLEIIQPLDDRSPYARSLAERNGADHIHHVRFDVEDYAAACDRLSGLGLRRVFEGEFDGAPGVSGKFVGTYYGTEDELGFIVEIGQSPSEFAMPEPEAVYPPSAGTETR